MTPIQVGITALLTEALKLANTIEARMAADPEMAAELNKLLLDRLTRANRLIDWAQDKLTHLLGIPDTK